MSEKPYAPPYKVTDEITRLVAEITALTDAAPSSGTGIPSPQLRRDNQVRTIHSSLAIENNTLSLEQVTDIIDGRRVMGPIDEIREVKNAYQAYESLAALNPYNIDDMLRAHHVLMTGLTKEAGRFRSGGVGVFEGGALVHMAPPPKIVPQLVHDLVTWVKDTNEHPLIKSCVFHYEFEFIHPFADGNGRMGRMWQTLLLASWKPLFAWLPVETIIKARQRGYYDVLGASDKAADSTAFVEFMLTTLRDALTQ